MRSGSRCNPCPPFLLFSQVRLDCLRINDHVVRYGPGPDPRPLVHVPFLLPWTDTLCFERRRVGWPRLALCVSTALLQLRCSGPA
jgi:hypothetical protein